MKFLRKHTALFHIFLFITTCIVASVAWFSGDWLFAGSVETWGPLHTFALICLSIFIAIVAAFNAINATAVASDTQRPFLNVSDCSIFGWQKTDGKQPTSANAIQIYIQNTGVFPSNDVVVTLATMKVDNTHQKYSYTLKKGNASILFPGDDHLLQFEKTEGENNLEIQPDSIDQMLIEVTITYKNQLSAKNCKTIRCYKTNYPYSNADTVPEYDYWD